VLAVLAGDIMTNQRSSSSSLSTERRSIDFHRHLQHGWRRSPFLLTVALRMKRNYSRVIVSSPTAPDDSYPESEAA
jgi:hypothetical protein